MISSCKLAVIGILNIIDQQIHHRTLVNMLLESKIWNSSSRLYLLVAIAMMVSSVYCYIIFGKQPTNAENVIEMVLAGEHDRDTYQEQDTPQEPASEASKLSSSERRKLLSKLHAITRKLKPLHEKKKKAEPGDWLTSHPEPGQTFRQYLTSDPIKLTKERNILYVLPLGDFNESEQKILKLSSEYLGLYFNCEMKTLEKIELKDVIPPKARRVHPTWGVDQIKSTYVLEEVLPERLPKDGFALICFTTMDLYPDENWNFVFGQAMLHQRVGVWSMARHGDAEKEYELSLRRTLKVATHETGHMFSMMHCIHYECNMCGSNGLRESDGYPTYLCPECEAKVGFATGGDAVKRLTALREFCERNKLKDEVEYYDKAIELLK